MTHIVTVPFFGGCACGAIRYECVEAPLRMVNCHCHDCQKVSGSGYSATVIMAAKSVRILRGRCMEHRIVATAAISQSGSSAVRAARRYLHRVLRDRISWG